MVMNMYWSRLPTPSESAPRTNPGPPTTLPNVTIIVSLQSMHQHTETTSNQTSPPDPPHWQTPSCGGPGSRGTTRACAQSGAGQTGCTRLLAWGWEVGRGGRGACMNSRLWVAKASWMSLHACDSEQGQWLQIQEGHFFPIIQDASRMQGGMGRREAGRAQGGTLQACQAQGR